MPQFMLLLHEDPAGARAMSPEEMQRVIERYGEWSRKLAVRGQLAGGQKLTDDGGRHLRPNGAGRGGVPGATVTDGPYVEGKEIVAGYFTIEAPDYDGAVAVAQECPHLAHGWIEVRRIDPV